MPLGMAVAVGSSTFLYKKTGNIWLCACLVGTIACLMGVLYGGEGNTYEALRAAFPAIAGFSFLTFNLLCAPCFAAMGAIKREMNSGKWTAFAIAYQCCFAYIISLMIYQIGSAFTGNINIIGLIVSILLLAGMLFMLFKPYKESNKLTKKVRIRK